MLAVSLRPPRPPPRLLASPFGMPGIQRGLYLIRDFIRFTSSRGLGAVELGANDRLTPSPRSWGNGTDICQGTPTIGGEFLKTRNKALVYGPLRDSSLSNF